MGRGMMEDWSWSLAVTRWRNRLAARAAARARPATAFRSQPEPRATGSAARGRQLCAGNLLFAGHLVEAPGAMIWDLPAPDWAWQAQIHDFGWLDDLAAVGDAPARALAQEWLWGWIARYGRGQGPGWVPDLAGQRLIRWTHHALFLLRGRDAAAATAFFRALGSQTLFLGRRWQVAPPGLPRFAALTGLIYAGLSLEGMEAQVDPACRALEAECEARVDAQGGIPSRNPEELLEVLSLLTWAAAALREADRSPGPAHLAAISRIAPTLRALRHADGGLARFQGGGRGAEGRLEQALVGAGLRWRPPEGLAMGYARLSAGRTSVIVDAAPPVLGRASGDAHASTLAFELTTGRRPLIVSCGTGEMFGEDWRRAGRATPSHSTLALAGQSSARLAERRRLAGVEVELLAEAPKRVPVELRATTEGPRLEAGHDGWRASHGLTHARVLQLSPDGRELSGEDMLMTLDEADRRQFSRKLDAGRLAGLPWEIRFHLHPEVEAEIDLGGAAVSLGLRSGEIWVFRPEPGVDLTLEPSVYLEKGRLRPRAAKQVVLSGRAMEYATRIRWSLAKAQDTALAVRDLVRDELDMML